MNSFTDLRNPTTTTTTIPLNTTTTLPTNVPRSHHENKNQIKHLNKPNNMLNNTKNRPKWKSNRSHIPTHTPPPKHNRIHYKRYHTPHTSHTSHTLTQHNGILKWFNPDTKYGFIIYKNQELFVHETAFINNIPSTKIIDYINHSVTFNIEFYIDKKTHQKKQKAINVFIITNKNNTINNNPMNNNKISNGKGKYKGILLWFNEDKKFGFIKCDNNNNDLFVYESELKFNKKSLYKGMRLQFDIEMYFDHFGQEKRKAINVSVDTANRNNIPPLSGEPWKPNISKQMSTMRCDGSYRHNRLHYTYSNRIFNSHLESQQYKGHLLWFDNHKKHGFIECDNINIIDDVFVYQTDFLFEKYLIQKDMRLLFHIKTYKDSKGKEKKKAINVMIDQNYKEPQTQIPIKHEPSKFEMGQKGNNTFGKKVIKTNEINTHTIINENGNVIQTVKATQTVTTTHTFTNGYGNNIKEYSHVQFKEKQIEISKVNNKIEMEEKTLNAEAAPFIPGSFITKPIPKKIILEPIIESENEEEIIDNIKNILINDMKRERSKINNKKKRKKKKKNVFEKLFDINECEIIASKLIDMFKSNENNNMMYIYNRLYGLEKTYRNKLFLEVNLEFLSLLEEQKSILNVMYYVNKNRHQLIDIYFNKLVNINLNLNDIKNEFKDYGLKCVYPSNNNNIIKDLINKNSDINEFIKYKCYDFINYFGMYEILNYMLPTYVFNNCGSEEVFKFMKLMVADDDIDDFDNNDKLLLLSILVTIFHKYNMLTGGDMLNKNGEIFCNFITELISKDILSYDVIDKWRLDEYDIVTVGKKDALILLTDLIHELQNKEIKDNIISGFLFNLTDDEYEYDIDCNEYEMYYLKYLNEAYIGTDDLMAINTNRHVSNRCPWKYS